MRAIRVMPGSRWAEFRQLEHAAGPAALAAPTPDEPGDNVSLLALASLPPSLSPKVCTIA